jgi:hypothetical protein
VEVRHAALWRVRHVPLLLPCKRHRLVLPGVGNRYQVEVELTLRCKNVGLLVCYEARGILRVMINSPLPLCGVQGLEDC